SGRARAFGDDACLARYRAAIGALATATSPVSLVPHDGKGGGGPRPLLVQPVAATAFEPLAGADLAWWEEQQKRLGGKGGPGRDIVVYEAVNFMDGNRTSAEIADGLSCEFETKIDREWVDRLTALLAGLKLVAPH